MSPKVIIIELQKLSVPIRFEFKDKVFIVENQYFVNELLGDKNLVEDKYLCSSVTTDGSELLIDSDLSSESILQKEYDDIDSIEVALSELLDAKQINI